MKQYLRLVICIILCTSLSLNVRAVDITVDYLNYSVSGNDATVIGYIADILPKDVVIPETIEYNGLTFNVTSIGANAFKGCKTIETIVFPENVKSIGGSSYYYGAFYNCSNLKKVTLKGVEDIEAGAFSQCSMLKQIDLGSKLKNIDEKAFKNCSSLTYLVFPSTLKWIYGSSMGAPFEGCDLVQAVITLGDNPFTPNGLKNIKIYTRKDFITWDSNNFAYTGKEIEPEYTNNLPFKFIPDDILLEKNVGKYTTTGPITFSNNDMSFTVEIPYEYTISPLTVTARVKNVAREYGEANPEFGAEFSGFVSGEDQSVLTNKGSYSTTAKSKSEVGTYEITLYGMEAQNYVFQYESGNLTVTKAPLSISIGNYTIKQWEPLPKFVATYNGFKNGETESVLTSLPSINCEVTNSQTIGEYPVVISGADSKNYEIDYINGILTIEKNMNPLGKCATPTISIDNGKIIFACETTGVNYHYDITHSDVKSGSGNDVELSNTFTIKVYATKDYYENSEVTTYVFPCLVGDVDGNGVVNVADHVKLSDIILGKE